MTTLTPLEVLHQHFCGDRHEPRNYMQTPHIICGRICATNGHWLGALDQLPADDPGLPSFGLQRGYDPSNILQAVYAYTGDFVPASAIGIAIESERCKACKGTGRATVVQCHECDGDGYFVHGSHEYNCKHCDADGEITRAGQGPACTDCDGKGNVPALSPSTHTDDAAGATASSIYIAALRAIGGEISSTTTPSQSGGKLWVVRFPGGHGALMPMNNTRPLLLADSDLAPAASEPEAAPVGGAA